MSAAGGVSSHHIDLTSQGLGAGAELRHLRYPEWLWSLMSAKHPGAETRLRKSDHISAIQAAGLTATVVNEASLGDMPVARNLLARPFRKKSDDDIRCTMVHIVSWRPDRHMKATY